MQSACTPESERFFSLAALPQLAENSRQGSKRKNHRLVSGFATLNSQTTQWGSWQSSSSTASGPTVYLYDGMNLLEEVDQSGNVLARYTQGDDIDESLSELRGGTTSYYQADALGSVTSLSNGTGALANTYTYDSFGKLSASTGTITNPFEFTGREFDQETGMYFNRARYYDLGTGRFASEDPLGFAGGPNFYEYVQNNPLDFVDPLGLQSTTPLRPGCYPPFLTPCGPPAYGSPVDTTPPPPPTPSVPSWWPGSGPGSGSSTSAGPNPSPSPGPGPGPAPGGSCSTRKTKKECTDRRNSEMAECNEKYSGYPNLLRKCRSRASERWNACLRGIPDPGPLDPLDPTWSPD
jgi:RHS repeat-associated protein